MLSRPGVRGHVSSGSCVSGLVGIDVSTGNVAGPTIEEQRRQALANCEAILQAAGATLDQVVEPSWACRFPASSSRSA